MGTSGRILLSFLVCGIVSVPLNGEKRVDQKREPLGSVIFLHPDGAGASHWAALRALDHGPDGYTEWDQLEKMGLYRGHLGNSLVSTSNGGATAHAFGIKPEHDDYGIDPDRPFKALSGYSGSIMTEARDEGMAIGIVNSGHIAEPGTGVFLANAALRSMTDTITSQIMESGADVIMSGGEVLLLPKGVTGHFGKEGVRTDGRNLIDEAKKSGYTVVYTNWQLAATPDTVSRLLGVFAPGHTFHDMPEEDLKQKELPLYVESAPTIDEMTKKALAILDKKGKHFLLVVEEEGTDNFANDNNAPGELEALRRADAAVGTARRYVDTHEQVMLIMAADSDAGGMKTVAVKDSSRFGKPLPSVMRNGAALDGIEGTGSLPFVAKPDRYGNRFQFGIAWAGYSDVGGGIVARAHGTNADRLPANVDNTDIYRMMYLTLFGTWLQ